MNKVMIIITTSFVKCGGLTSVMMNYLRYIVSEGLEISILSGNKPEDALMEECKSLGINYVCVPGRRKNVIRYFGNLKKELNGYDVVHVNANSATAAIELFAAKSAGVHNRIVHNHNSVCTHKIAHALLSPVYRKLYTCAIACSKKAGDWIYGEGNYSILNNSIDTQKYRFSIEERLKIRKEYKIPEDAFVIGHVGKIYKPKNHDKIISVFNEILKTDSNSYLLLVGDGELRDEAEKQVNGLGIEDKVIFAGMRADTERYLSAIDCFLFPSLWEGLPLALLEAQASGLNCVVSDVIDRDAFICESVIPLSLNENDNIWAKQVYQCKDYNRTEMCEENVKKLVDAKYDVRQNAETLKELYKSM